MQAEYARATASTNMDWKGLEGYFIDSTEVADALSERSSVGIYMFHSNGACKRNYWRPNTVEESITRAVEAYQDEATISQYSNWNGFYFIEEDTLKAWLPITYFGSRINLKETVMCQFEGYMRDSVTITGWRMTEPYGRPSSMKFNEKTYQSMRELNTTLKFQYYPEVENMNNSLEWVKGQINRSPFQFFN